MIQHHEIFTAFILRVFLGILFFAQGYDKVFRIKISGVVQTFEHPLIVRHMPRWILVLSACFTSFVEMICGFMLILGFVKYYALYLLGIDLLMVAVAFSIIEPMWDLRHVFPRMVLLLAAFIIPSEWDIISIDWAWSLFRFIRSIGIL
jgi:uncharacterized membrane protein YphA (DoxX/SURF4 family)